MGKNPAGFLTMKDARRFAAHLEQSYRHKAKGQRAGLMWEVMRLTASRPCDLETLRFCDLDPGCAWVRLKCKKTRRSKKVKDFYRRTLLCCTKAHRAALVKKREALAAGPKGVVRSGNARLFQVDGKALEKRVREVRGSFSPSDGALECDLKKN
jgi:integrase